MVKLFFLVIVSCNICFIKVFNFLFLIGFFWICITFVFIIVIVGNMVSYLFVEGKDFIWKYDFYKGILKF